VWLLAHTSRWYGDRHFVGLTIYILLKDCFFRHETAVISLSVCGRGTCKILLMMHCWKGPFQYGWPTTVGHCLNLGRSIDFSPAMVKPHEEIQSRVGCSIPSVYIDRGFAIALVFIFDIMAKSQWVADSAINPDMCEIVQTSLSCRKAI